MGRVVGLNALTLGRRAKLLRASASEQSLTAKQVASFEAAWARTNDPMELIEAARELGLDLWLVPNELVVYGNSITGFGMQHYSYTSAPAFWRAARLWREGDVDAAVDWLARLLAYDHAGAAEKEALAGRLRAAASEAAVSARLRELMDRQWDVVVPASPTAARGRRP